MRVHGLELTAFGPFADTQRVDFDNLAAGGIFLFHGPTGAGKTSILDAVCFALYGQVPGPRQQARSLRSDHAAASARPEVVLEVTLRGRRFRVTRSPSWERPKRRGTGTTTEPAKVLVQERSGSGSGWVTLTTRADEAGDLLGKLLGLTAGQFCQVALLPQGQFAEFLRADADRRRDVLESLFDTGRFASVESWLVALRKSSRAELDEVDQQVHRVLARVGQAGATEVPPDLALADAPDWVAAVLADASAAFDEAGRDAAEAAAARALATAAREQGTVLRRQQERHAQVRRRHDELLAQQARRDAAAAEVEAARQVAPVLPLLAEVGRLQVEMEAARAAATTLYVRVAADLAATGTTGASEHSSALSGTATATAGRAVGATAGTELPPPTVAASSAASARAEIVRLDQLAEDEAEAQRLAGEHDRLEHSVVALAAQADAVAAWLDTATDRRATLIERRAVATAAEAALATAAADLGRARDRALAATRRDDLRDRSDAARDDLRRRTDIAQDARDGWLGLRQARLDGMAAELAARLVPGDACPVCGSDSHPAPATSSSPPVTRAEEDRAHRRATTAEADRGAAQAALAGLEVEVAEQRTAAGGDTELSELRAHVAAAERHLATLTSVAAGRADAEAAVARFDEERESQVRAQVRLAQERAAAGDRSRDLLTRLGRLRESVDAARGNDPTISARAARLTRLADEYERLAAHLTELDRLGGATAQAHRRAEQAVRERDLGPLDAVAAVARDDSVVVELDELRRRHDAERAAVDELLADPDLVAAAAEPAPDLALLAAAAEQAENRHDVAVGRLAAGRTMVTELTGLASRLDKVLRARAPLAERHQVADALSRLAEGKSADNRLRMSLSGYVLAARLEQVAAAASERLLRMTSGRYSLLHTAEAATARGRGGLHLRVLDAWTGADRDPATLSGGEAFSASLALALGLADVVSAEAGGSLLETLFVDEGFGSLDEDSLDEVMGVLDGLRDGGRVVGLVSHVADLRQRIPVQLHVDKGRRGSTISQ